MTTAILDTNVLVQAVIGTTRAASSLIIQAYGLKRFRLVFSLDTLEECHAVMSHPKIAARHGWSSEELGKYFTFLLANSDFFEPTLRVSPSVTRDMTDTKFLSLASRSSADFLVTNDRQHLRPIGSYGRTQIVTAAEFLRHINEVG